MKSIDEAARKYAVHMVGSDSYEQNDLEEGFKAGVEFAQEWYSVDEKLPENVESLLVATNEKRLKRQIVGFVKTKQVLVKFRDGTFDLGRRCKCRTDDYYFWDCLESFEKNNHRNIIEWRPIEIN